MSSFMDFVDKFDTGGEYHDFYDKTEGLFRKGRDIYMQKLAQKNLPKPKGENLDNDRELTSFKEEENKFLKSFNSVKSYVKNNPLIVVGGAIFTLLIVNLLQGGKK